MNVEPTILVAIGVVLVIGGMMRRPWNVRIQAGKGNFTVANRVGGSVAQTYHQGVGTPEPAGGSGGPAREPSTIGVREFIGWGIAAVGVVLTGLGVYLSYIRP